MNYPVGDFLTQVKNTALARKHEAKVKKTKLIKTVALVLKNEGFLDEVKEEEGFLDLRLAYRKKEPVIVDLKLISKPSLRVYAGVDDLEKKRGPSVYILSTSQGIMSSEQAKKK